MHGTIDIDTTIEHARRDFPALTRLLAGYFHQDWHEEYETTGAAVGAFRREVSPTGLSETAADLDRLLGMGLDEGSLGRLLRDGFGCNYVPEVDELGNGDWLRQLRGQLAGQPPN